jgi:hypothetical protein
MIAPSRPPERCRNRVESCCVRSVALLEKQSLKAFRNEVLREQS